MQWILRAFFRLLLGLLLIAIAMTCAGLVGVYFGRINLPARWNPFAPYDVRAPSGPLTPLQYWRTVHDPRMCQIALTWTELRYHPVRDATPADGCTLQNVVRVTNGAVPFNHPFLATCPLALAMARFEQHDLQAAAQAAYGQKVRQIEHVGSYACRAIRTESTPTRPAPSTLSQHAHANAIDISGFVLASGREITIDRHWQGDSADARFLHAAHADACDAFNTTLGPDYNALHRAHFHVDMGTYRICR